jgi:hypothetical protein
MDPANLPEGDVKTMNFGGGEGSKAKAWKDIWGSGQGIGAVTEVASAAAFIEKLKREYLAAASLAPDGVLRVDRPMARILQRYGRLVMPYLAALTVCVLVAALVRPWLDEEVVPASPTLGQLIAHGLLLQDLLGYESLSTGVWYVAIDFQLFVLALALVGLPALLQRGSAPASARHAGCPWRWCSGWPWPRSRSSTATRSWTTPASISSVPTASACWCSGSGAPRASAPGRARSRCWRWWARARWPSTGAAASLPRW